MVSRVVSVDENFDFPKGVAARQAEVVASQIKSATKGLPASGQFELQPLWVTGHSWLANNNNATANARFFERTAKRLGMGAITNKGVSGRTSGDIANLTLGGANAWVPRTKALAILMCTINDVTLFDGSAASRQGYGYAWRSMLSCITANAAVAANTKSFVYSNGWTSVAVTGTASTPQAVTENSTGGMQWTTSTVGSYFEFTFTGTQADVFLVAKKAGAGVVTFAEGSAALGALNLSAPVAQDVPAVFRIRNRGSGTHTIRGTLTSGSSATVDSYRIPHTAPVPILVLGEPRIIPVVTDHPTYLADVELFKSDLANIVDEFPSARYLDLNTKPGWDTSTMLSADGKHPQDWGSAWIADRIQEELSTFSYSTGLNVLASSYPSTYTVPAGPTIPSGGSSGDLAGVPQVNVADDFNAPDGDLSGRTTPTGGLVWAGSNTIKIAGNLVRLVSTNNSGDSDRAAVINAGITNGTTSVTLAALNTNARTCSGLLIRYEGPDDFISARAFHQTTAGTQYYAIWRTVAGVQTCLAASTTVPKAGDTMSVTMAGPQIVLHVNGTAIATATESAFLASTRYGMVLNFSDQVSTVDNFSFRS